MTTISSKFLKLFFTFCNPEKFGGGNGDGGNILDIPCFTVPFGTLTGSFFYILTHNYYNICDEKELSNWKSYINPGLFIGFSIGVLELMLYRADFSISGPFFYHRLGM